MSEHLNGSIDIIGKIASVGLSHFQSVSEGNAAERMELTLCDKNKNHIEVVFFEYGFYARFYGVVLAQM